MSPSQRPLGGSPGLRLPVFTVGDCTLSARLWVPFAFRLTAFASETFLSCWRILLPLRSAYWAPAQTPSGFPRSASSKIRMGWVPSLRRAAVSPHRFKPIPMPLSPYHRLGQPSLPVICNIDAYEDSLAFTRPYFPWPEFHGWLAFPFGFITLLRTLPLPATHGVIGNRVLDTFLGLSSASRCDFVSQGFFAYYRVEITEKDRP